MGKKEGCNKMSKKTHFVTAPFLLSNLSVSFADSSPIRRATSHELRATSLFTKLCYNGHRKANQAWYNELQKNFNSR